MNSRGSKRNPRKPKKTRNPNNRKTQKIHKMNCSPIVEGQTPVRDSCYTDEALLKIRDAYNKNHPEKQITSQDPVVIFQELKSNLSHCEKEDCWLKQLPTDQQKYLDAYLFAPDHPKEWKKNPDEWLSNFDIFNVLQQYQSRYKYFRVIGPTPIDFDKRLPNEGGRCVWQELCEFSLEKFVKQGVHQMGIVFNLDKHNEPGSHWTSLYVDLKNRFLFYFDSAANKTPKSVLDLVEKIKAQGKQLRRPISFRYYESYPVQHQQSNTECGMYSLFFIITMLTGKTEFTKNMTTAQKLRLFRNKKIPDKYVFQFRKIYFNEPSSS